MRVAAGGLEIGGSRWRGLRGGGRGADFVRVGALAGGVHRRNFVKIFGAVSDGCIGEGVRSRRGDLCFGAGSCGAFNVVAGGAGAGIPGESDFRVAGCALQTGRCCGSGWRRRGRGAYFVRVGAFAGGIYGGNDVKIFGAVGDAGVGEAIRSGRGDLGFSARNCGAFDVIAGRAGGGVPGERYLGVPGSGCKTCGNCGRRERGSGADFRGVGACAGRVGSGDDVKIFGAVGQRRVGEGCSGLGSDGGIRAADGR